MGRMRFTPPDDTPEVIPVDIVTHRVDLSYEWSLETWPFPPKPEPVEDGE